MAELDKNTIKRLSKLLPMLTSDQPGEVTATVAAILRALNSADASIHDLVAALGKQQKPRVIERIVYRDRVVVEERIVYRDRAPAPKDVAGAAMSADDVSKAARTLLADAFLHDRERDFVCNMLARAEREGERFSITSKQSVWLRELTVRHREMEAGRG
ncbi:hypothetical protein HB780_22530 [Rhizobium lusitanum]|uniref:hypothetical protein n=1 Tax=Rhizobium lusitanum TaxID=293958 RepID=UPI00160813C6|nr:hypothetical protein [Rhizobium lusitanum]QND48390.1 hypothetical protein HB780_22530 [Rhizobium lusitanum]